MNNAQIERIRANTVARVSDAIISFREISNPRILTTARETNGKDARAD